MSLRQWNSNSPKKAFRCYSVTGESRSKPLTTNKLLRCESEDDVQEVHFDKALIVLGRRANTQGLGLEDLGIPLNKNGTVDVNKYLQCIYPNIFACGDVAGPFQLTHAGAHQAWYCAMNALFRKLKKFRVDYSVIPYAVFTDPEVARVGISERDASEQGIEYEVTRYGIDDLDRAIADGEARGFVKVLTPPRRDKILGVAIVGSHSAEIISEFVLAMRHGLGLGKILGTVHSYPTWAEANKYARPANGEKRACHRACWTYLRALSSLAALTPQREWNQEKQ